MGFECMKRQNKCAEKFALLFEANTMRGRKSAKNQMYRFCFDADDRYRVIFILFSRLHCEHYNRVIHDDIKCDTYCNEKRDRYTIFTSSQR